MIVNFDPEFQEAVGAKLNSVFARDLSELSDVTRDQVQGVVVRLGVRVDQNFLKKFPKIRFVATITTGLDHIDFEECNQRQIKILSLKGETDFLRSIRATSEHTMALLLALIRHIPAADLDVKSGQWNRRSFFGTELFNKTMGIIGLGRIGTQVAEYAKAFGMKVVYCDIADKNILYPRLRLEDMLSESDIVSVHVNYDKSTHKMLNRKILESFKFGSYLVNTSRGQVIDEQALADLVESGHFAGVAVDVIEDEFNSRASPLLKIAKSHNVLVTPHIGGSTNESMARTAQFIASKILSEGFLDENSSGEKF